MDRNKRHSAGILPVFLLLCLLICACGGAMQEPETQAEITVLPEEITAAEALVGSPVHAAEALVYHPGNCTVTFLDVGQGHAALFRAGDAAVMIDGGGQETSSYVVSWLQSQGVKKLDLMVATHGDADHISGLIGVMNTVSVQEIWMTEMTEETRTVQSFLRTAREKEIPALIPAPGDQRSINGMTFTLLSPFETDPEIENNNSLVVRMDYGKIRVLVTGDAQTEAEERMIAEGMDVSSDILLCGHHGSANSSSKAFLQAVHPRFAVISCGKDNPYEHPHDATIRRLRQAGAAVFRTDLQGTAKCVIDGESVTWNLEPWEP